MAAILVVGIVCCNPTTEKRIPQEGLYWIEQNSYYAVDSAEEIFIGLDLFAVGEDTGAMVADVREITFSDANHNEYPVLNHTYEITNIGNEGNLNRKTTLDKYVLGVWFAPSQSVTFTQITYERNGVKYRENIGSIQVEYLESSGDWQALQNRISWVSVTQPTFNHAEYILENRGEEEANVTNVTYGNSGIRTGHWRDCTVQAKEEVELDVEILLNETKGVPIVYYMKPVLHVETDNAAKECVFANVSKEAFFGDKDFIREYLYQRSEQKRFE